MLERMFAAVAVFLLVAGIYIASRFGTDIAIWTVWMPTLLLPTYSVFYGAGVEFSLPTVAAIGILASYRFSPGFKLPTWCFLDWIFVASALAAGLSEYLNGGGPIVSAEVVRRWGLPYLMGRLALQATAGEIPPIAIRSAACVAAAATVLAGFEAVTHVNPYWLVGGHKWEYMTRYGLRRASGPAEHTIGFAMLLVSFWPWALEIRRRALVGQEAILWKYLPVAVAGGLICTVSRGGWIASAVVMGSFFVLRRPQYRQTMVLCGVAAVLTAVFFRAEMFQVLNNLTGEDATSVVGRVNIDGKIYDYTGTNHRYLQFLVYENPLRGAGLFGYGYEGLDRFARAMQKKEFVPGLPTNVPRSFYSIDSHYLLTILKRGWFGAGLWLLAALIAIWTAARIRHKSDQFLSQSIAATVVGTLVGLLSVFSHRPFEEAYVFLFGLVAALAVRDRLSSDVEREKLETDGVRLANHRSSAPRPRVGSESTHVVG